jgi:hypothetical protein
MLLCILLLFVLKYFNGTKHYLRTFYQKNAKNDSDMYKYIFIHA